MTISTNATIFFDGTQDPLDDGTTSTIAADAFSVAADVQTWTNDDDAPLGSFVLECQFNTTMPTVGGIDLFAHLLNIRSTSEPGVPDTSNLTLYIGSFVIDFGVANDVNFFSEISLAQLPTHKSSQEIDFYLRNRGTGQTMGQDWNLWVTPIAQGPHA